MKRKSSVMTRALFSSAAMTTLMVVVLASLVMAAVRESFRRQLELRAGEMVQFLAAQSQFPLLVADRAALQQLAASALQAEDVLSVTIADGSASEQPVEVIRPGVNRAAAEHAIQVARTVAAPRDAMFGFGAAGPRPALGTILVGFSTAKQDVLFRSIAWYTAGIAALVLAIAIPLQFFDIKRTLEPLAELSRFAGRVGGGDLTRRAAVVRRDEIGDLTRAFNQMLDRLGATTVSRDYVDNIIRCMAESLIVVDPGGAILTVNQATLDLLGYPQGALTGQPASLVCDVENPGQGVLETVTTTYRNTFREGIPVLFSRAPLREADGRLTGEVWMAQDMTETNRTHAELMVARDAAENANRAKSLFLATMSHELRTPLNAMLGFTQLLQVEMEDSELNRWSPDLDKIQRAGQHLVGLINNILDLSRIDAGRIELSREEVDVAAVIQDVVATAEPLAARNGNRISASAGYALLTGDVMRIQQCVLNLIGNACKFTDHGEISIDGVLETGAEGDWYRIRVHDTGIGIAPADVAHLFGDFSQVDASTTRKYGGSGLGLAISRRLARLMGGDITVESAPGCGSTFTLHIPAAGAVVRELTTMGV